MNLSCFIICDEKMHVIILSFISPVFSEYLPCAKSKSRHQKWSSPGVTQGGGARQHKYIHKTRAGGKCQEINHHSHLSYPLGLLSVLVQGARGDPRKRKPEVPQGHLGKAMGRGWAVASGGEGWRDRWWLV